MVNNASLSFAKRDKYPIGNLLYKVLCLNNVGPPGVGASAFHNFIRHFDTTRNYYKSVAYNKQ